MSWYYAQGSAQKGPVEDADFERLVQSGVVTADTLVWREGLPDWLPYGQVQAAVPPIAVGQSSVACSQCGKTFSIEEVVTLEGGYVCATCKPVLLQKRREGVADTSTTAEGLRKEFLKHEGSLRSMGVLYILLAIFYVFSAVAAMLAQRSARVSGTPGLSAGILVLGIAALLMAIGIGLYRLKPWVRAPAGVISGFSALCCPISAVSGGVVSSIGVAIVFGLITALNIYTLYLLFSRKGAAVFSADYQRAIEATPQLKYRISIVLWILIGLVMLLLLLALFGLFLRTTVTRL